MGEFVLIYLTARLKGLYDTDCHGRVVRPIPGWGRKFALRDTRPDIIQPAEIFFAKGVPDGKTEKRSAGAFEP
jgi:hypothetical protein